MFGHFHSGSLPINIQYMTNAYEYLDELYESQPTRGKMGSSRDTEVNTRMAHLKRCEDKLNRYRNQGIL